MHAEPPPKTSAPLPSAQLWERLRALFGRVIASIGAPAIIAALTFAPGMRGGIVRQLALVETLARKLLLAEAAALAAQQPQRGPRLIETTLAASGLYTAPQTRRRSSAPAKSRALDLSKPETWPARFALAIPRDPRAVQDRHAPRIRALWGDTRALPAPKPEPRLHRTSEAFRVACRAEALRRLLHDPQPHAIRLAHARRIGVARSRDAITRYALKAPRRFVGDQRDPRLTLDIFGAAVRAHAILLTDTS